jgi:hypothetical protein
MTREVTPQRVSSDSAAEADCAQATINYVAPMAERPKFHAQDHRRDNLRLNPRRVAIRNARSLRDAPALEREGIALARHASAVRDFRDPEEVRRGYAREVEKLMLEQTSGA